MKVPGGGRTIPLSELVTAVVPLAGVEPALRTLGERTGTLQRNVAISESDLRLRSGTRAPGAG